MAQFERVWKPKRLSAYDVGLPVRVRPMSPIKSIPHHRGVDAPRQPYTITFVGQGIFLEMIVEPDRLPYGMTGLPGSILDSALEAGVEMDHLCGGVAACSTCQVRITQGLTSCNEPEEAELDQLDDATDRSVQSRLARQCVPNGSNDMVVEILRREVSC